MISDEAVQKALEAFTSKSMMNTKEARMQAALEAAESLLRADELAVVVILNDMRRGTDCRIDHNGNCQEHLWFGNPGAACPEARAKILLDGRRDAL